MSKPPSIPWDNPGWFRQAENWIRTQLALFGQRACGAIEQIHVRPWSTVLRVPTREGFLFFKAVLPAFRFEVALSQALADWYPGDILPVLAAEPEAGWMLLPDAGLPLRSRLGQPDYFPLWAKTFARYARIQMELSAHPELLLQHGAPDRRLERLPELLAALLEDTPILRIGEPNGLSKSEHRRLLDSLPAFASACQHLAASGIPASLHHDDFHDANVFLSAEQIYLTDWGECGLAHPFFSLMIALRGIVYRLDLAEDAPETQRLALGYLRHWSDFGPAEDLLPVFAEAQVIAMANRAMSWHQVVARLPEIYQQEHAGSVSGWLQEFLDHFERRGG